jgi:hypothetical protein
LKKTEAAACKIFEIGVRIHRSNASSVTQADWMCGSVNWATALALGFSCQATRWSWWPIRYP